MSFASYYPYDYYPYKILIRARTQSQLERAIVTVASRIAAMAVSTHVSEILAPVVAKTVARATTAGEFKDDDRELSATTVVSALKLLDDFEDCGNGRPPHWPWPLPWPWFQRTELDHWKPEPTPWKNSGLYDIAILSAVNGLAELVPEFCSALADTSQSLLKKLTG